MLLLRRFLPILALALLGLAPLMHADTCPANAQFHNPTNWSGALVTLSSLGVTTCYYVADSGSDSNAGTRVAPWHFAPGMANCSATCASTTISAGTGIIFKGGDTWNFGSTGAPNYIGAHSWSFAHAGTSSAWVYVGSDDTFYGGGSYARPIFSGDTTPTTGSGVAACAYNFDNGGNVWAIHDSYNYENDIEFTGFCSAGTDENQGGMIELGFSGQTNAVGYDNYFHGFEYVSGYTYDQSTAFQTGGNTSPDATIKCDGNVFDNSDGTYGATGAWPSGSASLFAIQNTCGEVAYNVFARVSNAMIGYVRSMHDNLFHDLYEPQGAQHGNILNSNNGSSTTCGRTGLNQYFYNNVFHDTNEGVNVWLEPCEAVGYVFNNVEWNVKNGVNCYLFGSGSSNTPNAIYFYDNTTDYYLDSSSEYCQARGPYNGTDPTFNGTMHFLNDHFIGAYTGITAGATKFATCDASAVCTFTDDNSATEIFQTEAAANAQGYTASNSYEPTSASGATVHAGGNESSLCATFSSDSALCSNVGSVTEVAGEGGKVVSYPAFTLNPRGSAWDSGAYQFSSGAATPNYVSPGAMLMGMLSGIETVPELLFGAPLP